MTDRELYNYIKTHYKPEKGTALFFDLRNYHLCGLHPRVILTGEELQFNCFQCCNPDRFALLDYLDDELLYDFTYKEFAQDENLTTGKILRYKIKQEFDLEELKEEFAQLILFLNNSEAS